MAARRQINKSWYLYPQQKEISNKLARELNVPAPVAQVLVNRGIHTVEEGIEFFNPSLSRLHSPFSIKDMERAVSIIQDHLQRGLKIAVYGDYDVDGITSTALVYSYLSRLGADVTYYIPSRLSEGYGLNNSALEVLKSKGVSLIITVDCGISSKEEVALAKEMGMEVIITDHHHPPASLPGAGAIVSPLQPECAYPFKHLSGVGVAFKLAQALEERVGSTCKAWDYLDLVALGTVADVCPLIGENRVLVTFGLKKMEEILRPGLQALCSAAGLDRDTFTVEDLAFIFSPRLNVAGRLGDAGNALKLLLAEYIEEALPAAQYLHAENSRRQKLEAGIAAEAGALAENILARDPETRFILLARQGWHQGVLGIVANRIAEKYRLPALLIALEEGGVGKGSGRSSGGFNLVEALAGCRSLLVGFGGHASAAGLTVKEDQIRELYLYLDEQARHYFATADPDPELFVDTVIEPEEISPGLVRALEKLAPYGNGNPQPFFLGSRWFLEQKREVGKAKNHLQLKVKKGDRLFQAICFNGKTKLQHADLLREMDLVFSLTFDRWRGNEALQLEVHQSTYNDEFSSATFTLVDRRRVKEKNRYLENLLQKENTVIVVVNTKQKQERLEKQLSRWPGLYFSHQGTVPPHLVKAGPLHLVLYDLPLREEKLRQLLEYLHQQREQELLHIHLLYDEEDFQENLKLFAATIPSPGSIEQVFHLLHETAGGRCVDLQEVKSSLKKNPVLAVTSYLLDRCLSILQQTTYLEQNGDKYINIRPTEPEEYCQMLKEVAAAESFQQERKRWKQFVRWQGYLLETPGAEIAAYLEQQV